MGKGLRSLSATVVVVSLIALLGGCPVPPPGGRGQGPAAGTARASAGDTGGAKAKTTTLAEAPDPGPGLEPGSYPMTAEKLATPVRVGAGPVFTAAGKGAWTALLFDAPQQLTLVLTEVGSGQFTLGVAARQDGKDAGTQTLRATSGRVAGQGTRVVFEGLQLARVKVPLGVEVPEGAGARTARSAYLQTSCETAKVKSGSGTITVRRVMDTLGRPLGTGMALWLDLDGDGAAEDWELTSGGTVGVAGRLCTLAVKGTAPPSLEVGRFSGPTGVVIFQAQDGRGQDTGVWGPTFGGTQTVKYLGTVKAAEALTGSAAIAYMIPGESSGAASATVPGRVQVEAGKAVALEAGGPVQIKVDAKAQSGNVLGTVELKTATGHPISGGSGEGSTGVVEVLDASGKVLSTSNAEFG